MMKRFFHILLLMCCTRVAQAQFFTGFNMGLGSGFTAMTSHRPHPYGTDLHDRSHTWGLSGFVSLEKKMFDRWIFSVGASAQAFTRNDKKLRNEMEKRFDAWFYDDRRTDPTNSTVAGTAAYLFSLQAGHRWPIGKKLNIMPYAGADLLLFNSKNYTYALRERGLNDFTVYSVKPKEKPAIVPCLGFDLRLEKGTGQYGLRFNLGWWSVHTRYSAEVSDHTGVLYSEKFNARPGFMYFNISFFLNASILSGSDEQPPVP